MDTIRSPDKNSYCISAKALQLLPVLPQQLGQKFDHTIKRSKIILVLSFQQTLVDFQSFLSSDRRRFLSVLPYMGMAANLFSGEESFEQIVNILSTEGPMWNLVKTVQAVSEKTFKDFTILYMYRSQGQGQITPTILTVAKQSNYFNHTL